MIPPIPNKYVMLGFGFLLSLGVVYSYGYYNGTQRDTKTREKALVRLVEAEKALAKVAIKKATDDTQRLTQSVVEASTLRREYEEAPVHPVDPVACVSDDQRRLLQQAASRTQPTL